MNVQGRFLTKDKNSQKKQFLIKEDNMKVNLLFSLMTAVENMLLFSENTRDLNQLLEYA